MSYHPRIELPETASFITTRCRNSELWFVNNSKLEQTILANLAKYSTRYNVKLYAFAIEGNHCQFPALFPDHKRSDFMRDLNSSIARAVPKHCQDFPGGGLWQRRYSGEVLPYDDVEEYFFYTVLQAVQDGLVEKISDYPGYNCFHDAVWGIKRKLKVVRWSEYNDARRHGASVSIKDYTDTVTLQYERLPGYEHLEQKEYAMLMQQKLEQRRQAIVKKRYAEGKRFLGTERLLGVRPGDRPRTSKRSGRFSHRPRVLSTCPKRRAYYKAWYFDIYFTYRDASKKYRSGALNTEFPSGTIRPAYRAPPGQSLVV